RKNGKSHGSQPDRREDYEAGIEVSRQEHRAELVVDSVAATTRAVGAVLAGCDALEKYRTGEPFRDAFVLACQEHLTNLLTPEAGEEAEPSPFSGSCGGSRNGSRP